MSDLILAAYEKRYSRQMSKRVSTNRIAAFVFMILFGLLICNQRYAKNMEMQTVLSVISLGAVFVILICQLSDRLHEKKSVEEYAQEMEQMEKILYNLDIDTYNKLGLVMDEVKGRIEYEEREQRHRRGICYLGVVAVAGAFSFAQFYVQSSLLQSQIGSMLNLFLTLVALLLSVFYVYTSMYSTNRKYRWLYNMLMNVMITKF